ncbi:carboxypeptidase-like regulatory domain-containing protein [Ideonella sp.]|uniref:carboxypeptidase-like regulatory domain-containing protein n=1 Tax=Ideonella sp. TaxID=1929293 RepID=UPI0035B49EB8
MNKPPKPLSHLSDAELLARVPAAAALADAPAEWQRRALAAWRAPATVSLAQAIDAVRQRVLAVLSFDSWAQAPLAAGLRSTGSATRQLVFSAEGRDIDLRIVPSGDRFAVSGQVLGPDDSGAVALAPEQAEATVYETPLDALGEFRLADVAPGRYQLSLLLAGHEIVLPPFDVGASPHDGRAG